MKGSSSARLPALNSCSLVASPCANPCPKKKKKVKTKKAKDKTGKDTQMPQIDFNQYENDNISTGYTKGTKRKLKLTVFLPDDKEENLEQKKMAQLEAHFRLKGTNCSDNRLLRETSVTSLQQSRLVSAKSRGHLLSLMPSKDALGSCGNYIDSDLVNSAKRELDLIRNHQGIRRPSRRESGELNALFKQSKKASRLRELMFGMHDKTNNSLAPVDHVIDSCCRRAYFLAPIPGKQMQKTSIINNNNWDVGQEQMRAYYEQTLRGRNSEDVRSNLNTPSTDRSLNKNVEFDFYF